MSDRKNERGRHDDANEPKFGNKKLSDRSS